MNKTFCSKWHYPQEMQGSLNNKILLFLLWPFGAWLYCFKQPQFKSSYVIFFLFSLLLCWHMSPMSDSGYDDFIGIKERFDTAIISTTDLKYEIDAYFSMADDAPKELYEDILTWFVKGCTNNYHFFFLLAAIPIAFCQLKSMRRITSDLNFKPSTWGLIILSLFIFPRDIITTQNPRFATGFWICVLCTLYYYGSGKRNWRYLLVSMLAPLCHSGLMPFVIVLFLSVLIPQNWKVLKYVALSSIPFAFFDAGLLGNVSFDFMPDTFARWINGYMSDESYAKHILKTGRSGFWWVDAGFLLLMKFAYIWMTFQLIKNWDKVEKNAESYNLISFFLFLFAFVNLTQFVPEFSTRYYNFLRVFCIYLWFKTFGLDKNYISSIKLLVIATSWFVFNRYGYIHGGALSVNTPTDIFYMPLPFLITKGLLW